MKREIKFKAQKIDNGEWVYGYYMHNPEKQTYLIVTHEEMNHVDPSTVGQYTGLKDKNGIEIYEGDMMKADNDRIYEVIWNQNAWRIGSKTFTKGEKRLEKIDEGDSYWIFDSTKYSNLSKLEIFGNIHDKELKQ